MITASMEDMVSGLPSSRGVMEGQFPLGANVHISRCSEGRIQIILNNSQPPTRAFRLRRARLESGVGFDSEEFGDLEQCVVLEFDHGVDNSAVVKVAEHLCGDFESDKNGDDLIDSVEAFQSLLENSNGSKWGFTKLVGLWGELALLERMLLLCSTDDERLSCIRAWKSTSIHCMDFVFNLAGSSFDVKTTTMTTRQHQITSVDQVSLGPHPQTGLLSIMIRPVAEGEGMSVIDLVSRVESSLDGEALNEFSSKVDALSIDQESCGSNWFRERAGRPMTLYQRTQVPGVDRFLPLPDGVPELSWAVQMPPMGMRDGELDNNLVSFIQSNTEAMLDE